MIDTHCHLTDPRLGAEIEIKRAREAGVDRMITLGTSLADSQKAIEMAEKFDGLYCAVGIHPEESQKLKVKSQNLRNELINLLRQPKVVAVGEIGLDKRAGIEIEIQQQLFKTQLEVVIETGLPVVIHNRDANEDVLRIVDEFKGKITGVFHCFSQDEKFLREVLARGFYVGFAGNVTFKKNQVLREVAKLVPNDRMLVETDAPYLSPEPLRGKWPNIPANVKITAEVLAGLGGVSLWRFEKQTTENALRLFTKMQNT